MNHLLIKKYIYFLLETFYYNCYSLTSTRYIYIRFFTILNMNKKIIIEDQIEKTEEERKNERFVKGMLERMNNKNYI